MNLLMFCSLPKSFYINLKLFNLKTAIKMPLLISYKVKCHIEKGCSVYIDTNEIRTGMVKIGWGGSDTISANRSILKLYSGCELSLGGGTTFAEGISIAVKGRLEIGKHFYCNRNCSISCDEKIVFGDNCLLGHGVEIRDGDGHFTGITDGETTAWMDNTEGIHIGENVWIAARAAVLKGAMIQKHSVIGYGSLITRKIEGNDEHVLLAGNPAKVVRRGILWKR